MTEVERVHENDLIENYLGWVFKELGGNSIITGMPAVSGLGQK